MVTNTWWLRLGIALHVEMRNGRLMTTVLGFGQARPLADLSQAHVTADEIVQQKEAEEKSARENAPLNPSPGVVIDP